MIDRFFSAALTFCLLAGGTVAIGSAMFDSQRAAPARIVELPRVVIVAERVAPTQAVALNGASRPGETASSRLQ